MEVHINVPLVSLPSLLSFNKPSIAITLVFTVPHMTPGPPAHLHLQLRSTLFPTFHPGTCHFTCLNQTARFSHSTVAPDIVPKVGYVHHQLSNHVPETLNPTEPRVIKWICDLGNFTYHIVFCWILAVKTFNSSCSHLQWCT